MTYVPNISVVTKYTYFVWTLSAVDTTYNAHRVLYAATFKPFVFTSPSTDCIIILTKHVRADRAQSNAY